MSGLGTKLRREILRSRWQFVAVAATIMLGIGFFHGSLASYGNLGRSYDLTYRQLAFGDVWVRMTEAPESLTKRLARVPGVKKAIGRTVLEVRVALRNRPVRQVMGRIISLPAEGQPAVNRVRVVEGRYLSPQGRREALLELSFARAQDYRVGEFIYPTIKGEEIRFRVVGLVQSPEYIYAIQSKQYLIPTPETFGVMFVPERQAELLFDMGGAINEICVTTEAGEREAVAQRLKPITDRYGGEDPITRDEQPSNKLLMMDLEGYRQMAVVFPLLFLTGALLTTYTLMARMVHSQSPQIGVLRATGFTREAVLRHYVGIALVPAVVGGVLGVGLGYFFTWLVTGMYVSLINVPYMFLDPRPDLAVIGLVIALAAGLLGAFAPARAAATMPPAVAMSQQAMLAGQLPTSVRWLGAGLPAALKLPVRNFARRPRRTAYTVLGIALGVCLIVLSFAILDSVEQALATYFDEIERYDLTAGFDREESGRLVSRIAGWPGVRRVEPTLDIPVDLVRGEIVHPTALVGIPPDGQLRRLTDESGRPLVPQSGEVLLGGMLRRKFGVAEGDQLRLDYSQNRRDFRISRLARVGPPVSQPIGSSAYMRIEDVQRMFADRLGFPTPAASGVLIAVDDPARVGWIKQRLDRIPSVAAVQTRADTREQIDELMRFSEAFMAILALFGVGLALAVVFTSVSINVVERTRELATLRTLGYSLRQISWSTTIENLLTATAGLAIGLPLGYWLNLALINSAQSESMTLEPVIFARTYALTVLGAFGLTLVSQIPGLLQVRRMDLAAATKDISG